MKKIEKVIWTGIKTFEKPERTALSLRFPIIKRPIIFSKRFFENIKNFHYKITRKRSEKFFSHVVTRHQSVLLRTLGDSDMRLQKQKVTNLDVALKKLNGVIIDPGKIFSFWSVVGNPTARRGYVKGMLLSNGKVIEGIGGGMCQLSNLLFWLFLHAPVTIVERHHHSRDVFPDSGRVLPFGSGATIMYNFVDLKIKNTSSQPLQLKLWLTDKHLKGQIVSSKVIPTKYHITEKNHYFVKRGKTYFRFNELWREELEQGKVLKSEHILTNFAPVLYRVDKRYLEKNNFEVLDYSKHKLI
jgi:vancomycin resistance protein VanW